MKDLVILKENKENLITIALGIATVAAGDETTLIFDNQNTKEQLTDKLIQQRGLVDEMKAISILADLKLLIDDGKNITIADIKNKCIKLKKEKALKYVIINNSELSEDEIIEIGKLNEELDLRIIILLNNN